MPDRIRRTCGRCVYPNNLHDASCILTTFIQNSYGAAIDTLEQVGNVVDSLYAKACLILLVVPNLLISDLWTCSTDGEDRVEVRGVGTCCICYRYSILFHSHNTPTFPHENYTSAPALRSTICNDLDGECFIVE